jgi:hypothetical protein
MLAASNLGMSQHVQSTFGRISAVPNAVNSTLSTAKCAAEFQSFHCGNAVLNSTLSTAKMRR